MTRFRAAFALLFQFLLLQAGVLGGGMACAPTWSNAGARPQARAAATHHGHAAHEPTATATGQETARETAPASAPAPEHVPDDPGTRHHGAQSSCAASAGCAGVVVPGPTVAGATIAVVREGMLSRRVPMPRSSPRTPEPPPPRG